MRHNGFFVSTSLLAILGFAASAHAADIVAPEQGLIFSGILGAEAGVRDKNLDHHAGSDGESGDDSSSTTLQVNGEGFLSIPVLDMLSVQLDAQGEFYDDNSGSEPSTMASVLGGHVSWRDPQVGLIGAFAGLALAADDGDGNTADGFIVGGEGQYYIDNLTLYAQAGYANIKTDEGEGFRNGWFVRGAGRYYFSDDFLLQADVSYGEANNYIDNHDDGEFWNWGAEAKFRLLDDVPLYGTLAYQGGYYDATTEHDTAETHAVLAGVSFLFGATTLKENDRYGATLDMPLLPSRAASLEEDLD